LPEALGHGRAHAGARSARRVPAARGRRARPGLPARRGGAVKAFCGVCGSSLFGGTWPEGPEVSIRFGALDTAPALRPQYRSFVADAAVRAELPDDRRP